MEKSQPNKEPEQLELFPARLPDTLTTVAQHNKLVFSSYEMTLLEHRIYYAFLAQIKKDDREFKAIEIPYHFVTGTGGENHEYVVKACKNLLKKTVEVNYNNDWFGFTFFSFIRADGNNKVIQGKFNNDMKGLLLYLKDNFSLTYYHNLFKLNTFYSRRLYEILYTYRFNPTEIEFKISSIRAWLGLGKKHKSWKEFRKRVLIPCQNKLSNTNMAFDFEPVRRGKAYNAIKFELICPPSQEKSLSSSLDEPGSKNISSTSQLPSNDSPTLIPALNVLNGVDFLFATGLFSDDEIEAIKSSIKRTDINRRVAACKASNEHFAIRKYFDDVVPQDQQQFS